MNIPHPNWVGDLGTRIANLMPELASIFGEMANRERANYDAIQRALNSAMPTGAILAWATSTAPNGWLICDGATITETDYPDLFAITGATLPNLKGRVVVGLDATQTEFDTLEETGGAKTHTLTTAEMPAHTHTYNDHVGGTRDAGAVAATIGPTAATTGSTGGGGAHNNLQPYIVLNYIIKT